MIFSFYFNWKENKACKNFYTKYGRQQYFTEKTHNISSYSVALYEIRDRSDQDRQLHNMSEQKKKGK